jgi:uncharacterized protein YbbC (DUF1343 family)
MTVDTVFDLASLTKVVATTTAIMQLRERGRIDLDAPVSRYWPEFARRGKARITVRQLLSHGSGLRAGLDLNNGWRGYRAAMERIAGERLHAPPGQRVIYSDLNFAVLGELVRRISGLSLDRYCESRIFEPLGMHDTAFRPADRLKARIAPTVYRHGAMARGEVHDPTAYRMGGIAGHAGLFSTADDLARFARMLVQEGAGDEMPVLGAGSIAAMAQVFPAGKEVQRGLGWEMVPLADNGQTTSFAFSHTGFTGTLLWIDPASRTYLVLLANRVHPDGGGDTGPLRRRVVEFLTRALSHEGARTAPAATTRVKPGIDVLAESDFAPLRGRRVGLITNHTGVSSAGVSTIELLRRAGNLTLAALFSPEHGLHGTADAPVASSAEASTGLPVYSLYGSTRRPTAAMLHGVDALVFDIQDAGVRFYTYITTMAYAMEEAAHRGIPFFVLDRPDPIGAAVVQGPLLDEDMRSFTGYFPLPLRYGMTIGELAQFLNAQAGIGADLTVIPMHGYRRSDWYDQTGLRWIAPSPNLRSITQAALYPGVAMLEGANVSVGRGTDAPFELLGAPWIDGARLAAVLESRRIAGVRFHPAAFTPSAGAYARTRCSGVRIELLERDALDSPQMGLELVAALYGLYPRDFRLEATAGMIGSRSIVKAIRNREDPGSIARSWTALLGPFFEARRKHLIYEAR